MCIRDRIRSARTSATTEGAARPSWAALFGVIADGLAVAVGVWCAERGDRHARREVRGDVVDHAGAEREVVPYLDVFGHVLEGVEPEGRELHVAVDPEAAADGDEASQ